MNAHSSQETFERLLAECGLELDRLTVPDGFALMFKFYRLERAEDCPADGDGDMLLYQWGTYDWGTGEAFELDITRQFILNGDAEDENIWQLSLTFKFSPTDQLRTLGKGNKWCHEPTTRTLEHFEALVLDSAAYQAVVGGQPSTIELDYFNAN